jgi:hypothetical protein
MSAKTPREVFVLLLSNARNHTERSIKAYEMIGQQAENPHVKEALKAREFVAEENLRTLDECFEMIGEKPVQVSGKLQEVFFEDFKRELVKSSHQRRGTCTFLQRPHTSHTCDLPSTPHWWPQPTQPRIMVSAFYWRVCLPTSWLFLSATADLSVT